VSAARRHLDRLTQLRLVIARLTAPASVATRRDDAPSRGPGGNFRGFGDTGEYLIAREIGALEALDRRTRATLRLAGRRRFSRPAARSSRRGRPSPATRRPRPPARARGSVRVPCRAPRPTDRRR